MARSDRRNHLASALYALGAATAVGSAELGRRVFRRSKLLKPAAEPVSGWDPRDHGLDPTLVDRLQIRSGPLMLDGWWSRVPNPRASILYCHGNSGNITWFVDAVKTINAFGFDVLLFDYRGFGRSAGRPTINGAIRDAAAAAVVFDEVRDPDLPAILWGYSLGGAIATRIADHERWSGLVLQSTFTSLPDIARVHFAGTPVPFLAGRILDTEAALKKLEIPVEIIHGDSDETVPYWMAERLSKSCVGSNFTSIAGGAHKNLHVIDPCSIGHAVNRLLARS